MILPSQVPTPCCTYVLAFGFKIRKGEVYFGKDEEVVAVKMHGVHGGEFVIDDDADRVVAAHVVDVPLLAIHFQSVPLEKLDAVRDEGDWRGHTGS